MNSKLLTAMLQVLLVNAISTTVAHEGVISEVMAATSELTASARASVAEALYAASATAAAAQRVSDERIFEQRRQIEGLQSKLNSAGARTAQLVTELAQAQESFVAQLAQRDRAYAQEIAVFRKAVVDIASTPEGEAALRQFNAGDEVGALSVLDRITAARERARQVRANIETAADKRRVATLALEARARGKVDTRAVITRYEEVTQLDPGLHWDWVELGRLYADAGKLEDAKRAALRATQTTEGDRDRSTALIDLGAVLVAQGDLAGARRRFEESYDIAKRLAAADPSSAALQRDVSISLIKLGEVQIAQGDLAGARRRFEASYDIDKRLAAADSSSAEHQRDVGVSLNKLGDVLVAQGDLAGARQRFEESHDILKRLAAADPSSAERQRDVGVSLNKLGDVLVAQGDLAGSRRRFEKCYDIAKRLAAADPSSADRQRDVWASMWKLVGFPDSGITWTLIVSAMEDMQRRGVLAPADVKHLEEARRKAASGPRSGS